MRSTFRPRLLILLLIAALAARAEDDTSEGRVFRPIMASDGIADNSAQTIICTKTGRLTITTIGSINFYDGANFSHINPDDEVKYKLEDYDGNYHLYYDNNHHLWLKNTHSVSCVNLTTESFISNIDSIFVLYGARQRVNDMFVDANGDLWLCSGNYVFSSKYRKKVRLQRSRKLQDLEIYDNRLLMLFYDDGYLFCYDLKANRRLYSNRAYTDAEAKLYPNSCVQLYHDKCFYLIRNGENGAILLKYSIEERQWTELMHFDYHLNNMVVHNGLLYIASSWGYYTYDLATQSVIHHKGLVMQDGRKLETDINTIEFDLQGGMWLGTEMRGVLYGRPLTAPFHILGWDNPEALRYAVMMDGLKGIGEFRGKKASVLFFDSRHWTWVGTPNGLYLYTTPKSQPVVFSRRNGLLNNVIHSVVEDNNGNIWVSTSYGISVVHIVDGKVGRVFSFNDADNLPNETFFDAKGMRLPDGQIVMQAIDHFVKFNPADFDSLLNQKPYQLNLKLTQLMVNGIIVSAGDVIDGNVIIERAVSRSREINLNYDQNSISLTFSALNFEHPLQTCYRVRVKEIKDEWSEFTYFNSNGLVDKRGLLHLPLVGLQPGTYHVEVMASTVQGQFVGRSFEWIINVNQPWWRTTGIMMLLGLAVFVLIVANFFFYNRNTRLKMLRNNEEGDVIRRISAFVERCDSLSAEKLSPTQEEIYGTDAESQIELSPEFVDVMLKVLPFVHERHGRSFTMSQLSMATDMELLELYEMVSENVHKSPRVLICTMRIDKAAELLRTTDKTIEDIAHECGFISPNYMIAKFYHKYKMTPAEYREEEEH